MNIGTVFVTALLDLREDRSKERPMESRIQHFNRLAATGIPLILFLSSSYKGLIPTFANVTVVELELENLLTYQQVAEEGVKMPVHRTTHHDTRNFMILMNAKLELAVRCLSFTQATHVAWIDFNVCHVFRDGWALERLKLIAKSHLKRTLFAVPGCWHKGIGLDTLFDAVNWRFCGGFFLADRDSLVKAHTLFHELWPTVTLEKGLTWEVNMWAYMESKGWDPIWFKGDHNDSLVALPSTCFTAVATLTTIPSRLENGTCKRAIDSLIHQVDHVYLAIANRYERFPDAVMTVPEDLLTVEPYKSKLTVVRMEDMGPASKYLVSLSPQVRDSVANKWIFTGDDDQEYAEGLIQRMLTSVTEMAVYQNRFNAIQANTTGGLIHGYVGNMAHGSLLQGLREFTLPTCARFTDDQWMSIYYYLHSIPIRGTGIEEYTDLYRAFLDGHEQYSTDALAAVGNRLQKVQDISKYYGIRFIHQGQVMRVLSDMSGVEKGLIASPAIDGYESSSTSFLRFKGQGILNVRYVNYLLNNEGCYIIRDVNGHLKTQNVILRLKDSFEVESTTHMYVQTDLPRFSEDIQGLEDIRLYDGESCIKFIATQREFSPSRQNRMVIGDISYLGTHFINLQVIEPPVQTGCEKNWIPLGQGRFIYQWYPFQIGMVKDGRLDITCEYDVPKVFQGVRGSTIFTPLNSGRAIGLIHFSEEGGPRKYYHRLVTLDIATARPLEVSHPFTFGRIGIEFCIGMAIEGGNVRFWYSQHDKDAAWLSIPLSTFVFVPCL
jgi:hypothetical protein